MSGPYMVQLKNPSAGGSVQALSLRCPACRQMGSFEPIDRASDVVDQGSTNTPWLGHRRCPNVDCHAHVFVVHKGREVIASYPPQRIDFDPSNIPERVVAAMNEAVSCHAESCFTAAAIMIRKTLEEVCADRGAKGNDLKARLERLRDEVLIPKELLDGLQDLRLLGNDAAHIEARVYDEIGEEEVVLAIDVVKELLKGVYQVGNLVARLKARRRGADGHGP